MQTTDLFSVPRSMMISKMQKLVDEIRLIEIISNGTELFVRRHVLSVKHVTSHAVTGLKITIPQTEQTMGKT